MNRPEPIELENNLGPDAVTGEINRVPWHAYDQDEMDLYLAEKDKEIAKLESACRDYAVERDANQAAVYELRKEIESLKASHYAEMVDAGMRERRLRRALLVTLARLSESKALFYYHACDDDKRCATWRKVESKCRAKAEEYK